MENGLHVKVAKLVVNGVVSERDNFLKEIRLIFMTELLKKLDGGNITYRAFKPIKQEEGSCVRAQF